MGVEKRFEKNLSEAVGGRVINNRCEELGYEGRSGLSARSGMDRGKDGLIK